MNELSTKYEHRIPNSDKTIIQVRPERDAHGKPSLWGLYMQCDSEADARRILDLLNNPCLEVMP